jgi:hypothetical protein
MFGYLHVIFRSGKFQPERTAHPDPGAKEPHPASSVNVGATVWHGWDGSCTKVMVALEEFARFLV